MTRADDLIRRGKSLEMILQPDSGRSVGSETGAIAGGDLISQTSRPSEKGIGKWLVT